jgi:hypothetical protein
MSGGAKKKQPGTTLTRVQRGALQEHRATVEPGVAYTLPDGRTIMPLSWVKPYAKNPRRNEAAIDGVAHSLKLRGWMAPIAVDANMVIIYGHTRLLAAQRLGMTEGWVWKATHLPPEQVRAHRLADNRLAQNSTWDPELALEEIDALLAMGVPQIDTGFIDSDIAQFKGEWDSDIASKAVDKALETDAGAMGKVLVECRAVDVSAVRDIVWDALRGRFEMLSVEP